MIVCIDCFKLFQTISNKNKTSNGPNSQSESEKRMWHHAQTSWRKNVFYKLFERIIITRQSKLCWEIKTYSHSNWASVSAMFQSYVLTSGCLIELSAWQYQKVVTLSQADCKYKIQWVFKGTLPRSFGTRISRLYTRTTDVIM